ncbi:MAG TPA: hypothetical protein VN408_31565 [Actinoplanes sp.]|nr:hypothetical protein [Actinoplanes sp.]
MSEGFLLSHRRSVPSKLASRYATIAAAAVALIGMSFTPAQASPERTMSTEVVTAAAATGTDFYRIYCPSTTDHFHTADNVEVVRAVTTLNCVYEGVGARISSTPGDGLVPFYRLYRPGKIDHFHTTSWDEVIAAVTQKGYAYEGISGYVYPTGSTLGVPFYRVYKPSSGDHFHTRNWDEVVTTTRQGYIYEGIGARVLG